MKRYLAGVFITIIILLSGMPLSARNTDSLKMLLPHLSGLRKLEVLNRIIEATLYNNLDSACRYAALMKSESRKAKNNRYRALAYRGMGICNFYKNNYYQAEEYVLKAVAIQKQDKDSTGLANSYKILTGIYWETERYKKSVEVSFQALRLYEARNDIKGIVSSYNNIGLLYKRLGEPEKALKYYQKALEIAGSAKMDYNKGNLYNNLGIVLKNLKQYPKALNDYRKAIRAYRRESLMGGVATGYLNIGNVFVYHLYNPDSAFFYLNKGLQIAKNTDYTLQADFYTGLSRLYAKEGYPEKQVRFLKKALAIARVNRDIDREEEIHYALYQVYENSGNDKQALLQMKQYMRIRDTLSLMKAKVAIANLESKFENEKNRLVIRQMQEKQHADKKIKLLLSLGVILLLISFLLLVFGFVQSKKKSKLKRAVLEAEKEKLEHALQFKSRQLTSQALMMMKKNQLLNEIHKALSEIKGTTDDGKQKIIQAKKQLKKVIRSQEDWKLFRHYFEEVNPQFFKSLLKINPRITPSELKLAALVKLNFSIKESASLLNISPNSVKTIRSVLRKKLGLKKDESIYEFLNGSF